MSPNADWSLSYIAYDIICLLSMAFYSYYSLNVGCNGGNGNILSKQKSLFNSNKYDEFVAGLDEDGSFLHGDIL